GTTFTIEISSVAGFANSVLSQTGTGLSATFGGLIPNTIYHGRAKAVAFSGASSPYQVASDTQTLAATPPSNLAFTGSTINSLSASWNASVPPGDSYTLQLSTMSDFTGLVTSSVTA